MSQQSFLASTRGRGGRGGVENLASRCKAKESRGRSHYHTDSGSFYEGLPRKPQFENCNWQLSKWPERSTTVMGRNTSNRHGETHILGAPSAYTSRTGLSTALSLSRSAGS